MNVKEAVRVLWMAVLLAGLGLQAAAADDGCSGDCIPVFGGAGDFIEAGVVVDDVEDNVESFHQYGLWPQDWVTSGKVYFGDDYFASERFELRWWDISDQNGRGWLRLTMWPLTIEDDSAIAGGYLWNLLGPDPTLQSQEVQSHDLKLRLHRGELDNVLLRYQTAQYTRDSIGLPDYDYSRLSGQYSFDLAGGAVQGQLSQTAYSVDAPRVGTDIGETDTTRLKLNADLSEDWDAYGRFSYSMLNYEDLPDDEMSSSDATVGLRYRPGWFWEIDANYRLRDYPADNAVGSHVDDFNSYGLAVSYVPCGDRAWEAGYQHKELSYSRLNSQDATVRGLLRGSSVVTPADVAGAVTSVSPTIDSYWLNIRERLTDDLLLSSRIDYQDGDMPGTDVVAEGSPSLFYDENLTSLSTLTWDATPCDQLGLSYYNQEASNGARGGDLDMNYIEGSWARSLGSGWLTLAYRDTSFDLETPGLTNAWVTDDASYFASYTDRLDGWAYGLDFSYTEGEGAEEFSQTGAGADLEFECPCLGVPLALSVDWFDRSYDTWPTFDSQALEVALKWKFEF